MRKVRIASLWTYVTALSLVYLSGNLSYNLLDRQDQQPLNEHIIATDDDPILLAPINGKPYTTLAEEQAIMEKMYGYTVYLEKVHNNMIKVNPGVQPTPPPSQTPPPPPPPQSSCSQPPPISYNPSSSSNND